MKKWYRKCFLKKMYYLHIYIFYMNCLYVYIHDVMYVIICLHVYVMSLWIFFLLPLSVWIKSAEINPNFIVFQLYIWINCYFSFKGLQHYLYQFPFSKCSKMFQKYIVYTKGKKKRKNRTPSSWFGANRRTEQVRFTIKI